MHSFKRGFKLNSLRKENYWKGNGSTKLRILLANKGKEIVYGVLNEPHPVYL